MNIPGQPFSVLLLRPDSIAEPYGQDTFFTHVVATSSEHAVKIAQRRAADEDGQADDPIDPNDYAVLLVLEGHHQDVTAKEWT